jgi:hypothetical protein
VALAVAAVAVLAGPLAYATDTMASAYSGGDPSAGPQSAASIGGPGGNGPGGNGPGGLGAAASTDQTLVDYLVANQGSARWIVAASGSQVAAGIQLAAGLPVLTMGGFTGSDPAPTISELKALVASGQVRYVLLGVGPSGGPGGFPGFRGPGGPGGTADRTAWVGANCVAVSAAGLGSGGLYDCSGTTAG